MARCAARDGALETLHVIVGQEVRTTAGDLIALYVEQPIRPGLAPPRRPSRFATQGGVVGLAHPFDRFRAGAGRKGWENRARASYVRCSTSSKPGTRDCLSATAMLGRPQFARDHDLPGVASSDAHTVMEVGVAYTIARGPDRRRRRSSARRWPQGRTLVTARGSRLVRWRCRWPSWSSACAATAG